MPNTPAIVRKATRKVGGQRWRVAPWRLRAERTVLARTGRAQARTSGRILAYHSTGTPEWGVNDVTPANFVAQVELATQLGYQFVPLADVVAGESGPQDLALTFDDGLRSNLEVTPFLRERDIPYAVFVVAEWASAPGARFLSWPQLAELAAEGATIGSHSVTHANFRELTEAQRRTELVESRTAIEQQLGMTPELFAIPFGRARDWDAASTRLAHEAGYTAVFAQSEGRRPRGTVGRSFITKYDGARQMRAVLEGRFDRWEEWW